MLTVRNYSFAAMLSIAFCLMYALIFVLVPIVHFITHQDGLQYTALVLITGILLFVLLQFLASLPYMESTVTAVLLFLLCLIVKLAWVLSFPTKPAVDYLTFYKTAQMLAESWTIDFHYVALFSHIMGYASFLSLFFMIFGDGLLVAPIVNVVLSAVSMILIYDIAKQLFSRKAAVVAALLWIFYPSQTIYNTMVLSEPLYTTLILCFWALLIRVSDKLKDYTYVKLTSCALLAALLLGLVHASRPLSYILYIALIIWLLLTMNWSDRQAVWKKVVFVLIVGIGLGGMVQAITAYNSARLGEPAASSIGYTLYVGFNEQSKGKWNQEDSEHFYHYVDHYPHWTAVDVQRQMMIDAKERILSGNIDYVRLFYDKLHLLWNDDAMAYRYSDIPKEPNIYTHVSNVYYFFTMLLSVVGAVILQIRKRRAFVIMLCLYMLGLTASHMLAEVAYRYHYSGIPVFVILASVAVASLRMRKRAEAVAH